MASQIARQINAELYKLFDARTHELKAKIGARRGAPLKITKAKVRDSIAKLEALAESALLRSRKNKKILRSYDYKKQWHPKRGKGFGRSAKRQHFKKWYEKHIGTQNCVYAFWDGGRCLYVGRTLNGKGRPSSHFEKHWFSKSTRLDIYAFDRKRGVPRFECLFTHRHEPSYSKIRPAVKKFYTACPICDVQQEIKQEIRYLFRLK